MCVCVYIYIYINFLDYVSFCEVVSLLKKFPYVCVCVCVSTESSSTIFLNIIQWTPSAEKIELHNSYAMSQCSSK